MSAERIFIAKTVGNNVHKVEDAIDLALTSAATFAAELPEVRKQMGLSAVVGQDVFDVAATLVATLTDARRQVVEMHNRMDAVRAQIGMKPLAFGGCLKPFGTQHTGLSAIAA